MDEANTIQILGDASDGWYMMNFWHNLNEWSKATFGERELRGPTGPLKHLEKEAKEAYEETDLDKQKIEIADCLFLVFDAAWRAGMTFGDLVDACEAKLEINKASKWPKPTSDGPVEHDRSQDR